MAIKIKKKNDSFGLKCVTIGCNKIKARYAVNEVNPEFYKQFETMNISDKKITKIKH